MTGFFILPGRIDVPFMYQVRKVRDGGVYSLRSVEVHQPRPENPPGSRAAREHVTLGEAQSRAAHLALCFTATVSFKRREDPASFVGFRYQTPHMSAGHLGRTYANVLGKKLEDHPNAPGADAMWWTRSLGADLWAEGSEKFPGVDIRKVDMSLYNAGLGNPDRAGAWRQLNPYRLITDGEEEDDDDDETSVLNLHASAHLYSSDRNSLFLIPRALGFEEQVVAMSSLSHTVIFHGDPARLKMCTQQGEPMWFMQESWTEHGGSNRGCHESRLWRLAEDGEDEVIATTKQDGMLRVPADSISVESMLEIRRSKMDKTSKGKL
jgi:acyl-CoA thioesterase